MKKRSNRGVAAAELVRELGSDPEYLAEIEALDARERDLAAKPLLADLERMGLHLTSEWDLVNMRRQFRRSSLSLRSIWSDGMTTAAARASRAPSPLRPKAG